MTPFKFRAVISIPVGKTRSIFLIGGVVNIFLSTAGSSTELEEELIFLNEGDYGQIGEVVGWWVGKLCRCRLEKGRGGSGNGLGG